MAAASLTLTSRKENPMLSRIQYRFELKHIGGAGLSRDKIKDMVAKELRMNDQALIVPKNIESKYGGGRTVGEVYIYKTMAELKLIEPTHIQLRNKLIESKPKPQKKEYKKLKNKLKKLRGEKARSEVRAA